MSSEQEPLLPSSSSSEPQEQANQLQRGRLSTWRIRVAEALESAYVHKLVIALVSLSSHPLYNPHHLSFFDQTYFLFL
jgi:hypothetical protein